MVKKDRIKSHYLYELKVTFYTNMVHFPFRWLNHSNSMVKCEISYWLERGTKKGVETSP